jgi:anthranilate phosphoribosyltransferase
VQELGVALELGPRGAARCLDDAGVTFLFAPRFHPAMAQVVPVRRALGVRTAFNVLGPMLNPAGASHALVGVYTPTLARTIAEALQVRPAVPRELSLRGA